MALAIPRGASGQDCFPCEQVSFGRHAKALEANLLPYLIFIFFFKSFITWLCDHQRA
jgi:hypothetical protein